MAIKLVEFGIFFLASFWIQWQKSEINKFLWLDGKLHNDLDIRLCSHLNACHNAPHPCQRPLLSWHYFTTFHHQKRGSGSLTWDISIFDGIEFAARLHVVLYQKSAILKQLITIILRIFAEMFTEEHAIPTNIMNVCSWPFRPIGVP